MNHIELFAGCGGLSLGLHAEDFQLLFANEISPMAAETFAFNLLDEDLLTTSKNAEVLSEPLKTKWLSSKFSLDDLSKRLRENPHLTPKLGDGHSELDSIKDLEGSLVVGSIVQLNQWLLSRASDLKLLQSGFGAGKVDLVSGGPPCQSFSMNGLRDYSNSRNNLPWEFARFVNMVKPRFALLENVTGILRPFQVEGESIYAWFEVAKAFSKVGYLPLCLHANAKYAGVAQNRPRFLMILIREDVFDKIFSCAFGPAKELLASPKKFYKKFIGENEVDVSDLICFDVENPVHLELYKNSFLAPLVASYAKPVTVGEAIDDLCSGGGVRSNYLKILSSRLGAKLSLRVIANDERRNNGPRVTRRFSIYQNLCKLDDKKSLKEIKAVLRGKTKSLSDDAFEEFSKFTFIDSTGSDFRILSKGALEKYLASHGTKKQKQKALDSTLPAPAALSIPDDACHYSEPRTLSVREMARIQSFPDSFEFRSKITTGGDARKFEVPQYTQVGNAVPPLLGSALGQVLKSLDRLSEKSPRLLGKDETCRVSEFEVA
jgi:DNA (cytosine-5)-methyltransferase 1